MQNFSDKKIAIVADWLIDFGGAELVIEELLAMFPEAEIFTSVCFMKHPMLEWRKVHTSFIQKIPILNKKHKFAGLLRPWAFRRFDLSDFDLIICSCSAESKNVAMGKWRKNSQKWENEQKILQKPEIRGDEDFSQNSHKQENQDGKFFSQWVYETVNEQEKNETNTDFRSFSGFWPKIFVYCHTPIRYYWSHFEEYKNMMEFGIFNPIAKLIFPKVVNWMRKLDYEASQAVDVFWGNSETTLKRIQKFYHRDAEVIYPGIDVEQFSPSTEKWDFYLGIGRCIPYKKFDLLVDAFNKNGKKLILCTNTDNLLYRELKAKSKPNIEWIFAPSKQKRNELYSKAKAFLFPPEEDFGLVPVEAMASGTPVIAYGIGGATETVINEKTGMFFVPQTSDALNETIEKFEKLSLNTDEIIARGHEFSTKNFRKNILESIAKHLKND